MSSWTKYKLKNVATIESGGTPSSNNPLFWDKGDVNWATLPDLNNKYLFNTQRKITMLGLNNSSAKLLPINTVIFSSRATIGEVTIAKVETSTNQGSKNFICDDKIINYEFLYYWLKLNSSHIEKLASGTTYKEINKTVLSNIDICLPDHPTQANIVKVIANYDELISINEKRIKILEEMSHRLYDEWFIKFKFPEHEKVKMIDSNTGFGVIPESWKVVELGEIAQDNRKQVNPNIIDKNTPYVGLEHIPRKTIILSEWGDACSISSGKLAFYKGNILFGKIRPYFHKVIVAPLDGITSSDTIVISAKDEKWASLVLCCVSSERFVSHSTLTSQGTKMPRADWKTLKKYKVIICDKNTLARFNELVRKMVDEMNQLMYTNRALIPMRDLLISQLVTGIRKLRL